MSRRGILALSIGFGLSAVVTDQGLAQSGTIEEVVVTAQKRVENIQDVPISVIAVSGDDVEDLQAVTIEGLKGTLPNVEIGAFANTPSNAVFTIRGIGVIEPDPYAGNTVAIVVDGVPQYFSMGALVDLFDVNRIEVLRGPQGTLFGANTTGGVVNIVNNRPEDEFEGQVSLSLGDWDTVTAGAVINAPLSDTLATRVSLQHHRRDGWHTNVVDGSDLGSRDVTLLRAQLRVQPNDTFDGNLSFEYGRGRNGSPIVVAGNLPGEAEFVPPGFRDMYVSPCLPPGSVCDAPDDYFSANDSVPDRSDFDNYRLNWTMSFADTPVGDITSITSYKRAELFEFTDQDGTPVLLIDTRRGTEHWQFGQEVRTDIQFSDTVRATIGGFFQQTHYDHYQDLRIDFAGGVTYDLDTGELVKGLPGLFQKNIQDQDNWSASLFAQTYIDLTDRLSLQAGLRYAHEETEMLASLATSLAPGGVTTFDGVAPDGTPNISLGGAAPPLGDESWDNVGGKIGLDYAASDDLLLYTYYARGFKSGGFTGRIGIPQDIGPYEPEEVDTVEAGLKSELADGRLRLNMATFYTIYRDMQLAQIYFLGSGEDLIQGNTILNAAESNIYGVELDTIFAATDGLTLNASLAYLNAEYDDFPFQLPTGGVLDLSGERLQNAPEWSGSFGLEYAFDLGPGTGRVNFQYNYVGEKLLTSIVDTPRATIQSMDLVNANFEWRPTDEQYSIAFWVTNALDERYINHVFDSPGTLGLVQYAPPRQYGVSAKFSF